ncbi:MAG: S4 domain-containing protein, partial [Bacteroidota bacterium]
MTDEDLQESSELYEHYRFEADKGQSLVRLDKYLSQRMEAVSRSRIQAAADAGNILVNGEAAKPSYRIKPGDLITILLP